MMDQDTGGFGRIFFFLLLVFVIAYIAYLILDSGVIGGLLP